MQANARAAKINEKIQKKMREQNKDGKDPYIIPKGTRGKTKPRAKKIGLKGSEYISKLKQTE